MEKCPLTNLPCPNKRDIHITDVGSNYECTGEKHLCFVCGPTFVESEEDPLIEILSAVGKKVKERESKPKEIKKCSKCDFKLSDLIKGEKLGCPECYSKFSEELKPLIQGLQRSNKHVGKVPKNLNKSKEDLNKSKEELEKDLSKAIKEERYEEAKIIKDKLNALD